jgi:glycosyltransferase involved in cell wall biosynthesis
VAPGCGDTTGDDGSEGIFLHVLYVINSLTRGGAESSLAAMAPKLIEQGVRLDVVTLTSRPGFQDALVGAGASLTELSGSRTTWWRQVRDVVRAKRPDLVHTTLFEADLAGRVGAHLAGTPVVSTLANDAYGAAHRAELADRLLRLRTAQVADAVTAHLTVRLHAVSTHVADVMAPRLRYPRHRIDVIPRGRDPEVLGRRDTGRRERARARLGLDRESPLVLALARQEHQKGLDVLIDAVTPIRQAVPGVRVMVAGRTGNATAALSRQLVASASSETLTLLGARDDVHDLLCAADVFVLPSRREGLGGSLIEAMALECPVVLTNIPPFREVVDDSMALFVPPDDALALGAAVVETLSNPDKARTRAQAARRRFLDEYVIEGVAARMLAFYERALAGVKR